MQWRRDLELRDLDDLVEAEVLEAETNFGGRVGMRVSVSYGMMYTLLLDVRTV